MVEGRLSKEPRLAGKVCVISGASRGFGQGIALRFIEEGAKVVLLSRGSCEETINLVSFFFLKIYLFLSYFFCIII